MPHNWASAECVRYLRHMLALEDGQDLRLCAGITSAELRDKNEWVLKNSPTRFGRIDLTLGESREHVWRVRFERDAGPVPASVTLPSVMGGVKFHGVRGAASKIVRDVVELDPAARSWEAFFS